MIHPEDLEYHTPDDAGHTWAETYFIAIALPEDHLMATVYVAARPGIGVMLADVGIYGALSDNRGDMLYIDQQAHLPAPERFSDIRAANGLSIQAVRPPRDYRIDYVGHSGTEIHVDWIGLMDPFDVHDPAHSPHAAREGEDRHAKSGLGAAWNGHFDLSGRVTGTIKLRDREFAVNSIERMDHSWGHRNPLKMNAQNSISAAFDDEDLAFHIITAVDLDAPLGSDHSLAHGYVLEHGQVYGVVDAQVYSTRLNGLTTAMELVVTDTRGKRFHLFAMADVGGPWNAYSGTVTYTFQMTWVLEGRKGYGCVMETIGQPALSARRGRWFADPLPAVVTG